MSYIAFENVLVKTGRKNGLEMFTIMQNPLSA